jgi:hypothetical protein
LVFAKMPLCNRNLVMWSREYLSPSQRWKKP